MKNYSIRGIGLYETTTFTGLHKGVSFAGGADGFIAGSGFQDQPSDNTIFMGSSDLTGSYMEFQAPGLTILDEYHSATTDGRLYYRMPSISALTGQTVTTEMIKPFWTLSTWLDVQSGSDSRLACSTTNNCKVVYSWWYTPIWYYLSPPIMYHGMDVNLYMNPTNAPDYKRADQMAADIRLEGIRFLNTDYTVDWNMQKNKVQGLRGSVRANQRTNDVELDVWFRGAGYAMQNKESSTTCNWDGSDCYYGRIYPSIDSVSANSGSNEGGQEIIISGKSFDDAKNVEVTVDDVACDISEVTAGSITCMTNAKTLGAPQVSYAGEHGLYRTLINENSGANAGNWESFAGKRILLTSAEVGENYNTENSFSMIQGFYEAPVDGLYQFHMSCDDKCKLLMSLDDPADPTLDTMDPANKQELLARYWNNGFRDFHYDRSDYNATAPEENYSIGRTFSLWTRLTGGQKYYMENQWENDGGLEHWTVGVEIQPDVAVSADHPHLVPGKEEVIVHQDLLRDISQIRVTGADSGTFRLLMLKDDLEYHKSGEIVAGGDPSIMRNSIKGFYKDQFKVDPIVNLECEVNDGTIDTTCTHVNVTTHVYEITVPKSIDRPSCLQVMIWPNTTQSDIEFIYSEQIQLSTPTLKGSFFLTCGDLDGNLYRTEDLHRGAGTWDVQEALIEVCPWYRDTVQIWNGRDYYYSVDGIDFIFYYGRFKGSLPTITINSSLDDPLVGTNMTIVNEVVSTYGPNVYYDVLPFEQLYTYNVAPQVKVSIDDMPALCVGTQCGFSYEVPAALITGMTVVGLDIQATGTDLPLDITRITFGNQECMVTSNDATQISCGVANPISAGSWSVKVYTASGLVPVDALVANHDVALVVDSVSPTTLGSDGGEFVTFIGSGFPTGIETSDQVEIVFTDGTICMVESSTSTELICETEEFENALRQLQGLFQVNMNINGLNFNEDITLNQLEAKIKSITPDTVSPILPTLIEIQLNNKYDATNMMTEKFEVTLMPINPENKQRKLMVVDRDPATKTLTVKYGGAYSGEYMFKIESDLTRKFESKNKKLTVEVKYTDFNPKAGSKYGGQLVTIDGGVFSDDPLKNPIKIGYEYTSGVIHYCDVVTTSLNQVTCRMRLDYSRPAGNQELILFASTYEEAVCEASTCELTFLDSDALPTVENATPSYDSTLGKHIITVSGYDIADTSPSTVAAFIGGIEQTVLSVSPTSVIVQVDDVTTMNAQTFEVFFEVGAPNDLPLIYYGVNLTPEFQGLSISQGSTSGTTFEAYFSGVGINDTGITLVDASTDAEICDEIEIISYGVLQCKSKAQSLSTITVAAKMSNTKYTCNGFNGYSCTFETFTASQPSFTNPAIISANKMQLTGANLMMPGYDSCRMTHYNIVADSCEVNLAGNAIGTWSIGVPLSITPEVPVLVINVVNSPMASHIASSTDVVNTVFDDSDPTQDNVTCGYAGGCDQLVVSDGLAQNVLGGNMKVTVCGVESKLIDELSDESVAGFEVPAIATVFSEAAAGREGQAMLLKDFTEVASASSIEGTLFDGLNVPGLSNSGSNCSVGAKFASGFVGILDEMRFFMDYFPSKSVYDGNLKFQGSNDDFVADINDIVIVDANLHEGWNYFDLNQETYSSFRLFNAENNGCDDIGELKLFGKKVINESASSLTCDVKIVNVAEETSSMVTQTVTYDSSLSMFVDSISPRWGSVEGGTTVTFTGRNFGTTVADTYIYIDGIECVVQSVADTSIVCLTQPRFGLYEEDPNLEVWIAGKGYADNLGNSFRYVSLWSQDSTWGGRFAPADGESVVVPAGLDLMVDIDASPELNMVLVDGGSIIFPSDSDPNHERTFDAKVIFVRNGVFEAGTESDPYSSKLTITLHGEKYDPAIPIYGNKVLGIRYSTLDLHGLNRSDSWTHLDSTVSAGDSSITLIKTVDWAVNEKIMITSTNFDRNEAEERTITAVTTNGGKTTLFLDAPLSFGHYAGVDTYGTDTIEIRAEVALMTRNVIFQGDDSSLANEYGAHILIHAPGDNTNIGRISNVQFQNVGQFGQMGRYPVHFHMDGKVHESYVMNNVFLNSVNRGTTLHGVQYLRIIGNVYYNTRGHTIFVEDGVETQNRVEYNLVIKTEPSFSLLNTDSTPACFWLTNPDNILVGNVCAGSDHYGFWYDLVENPTGPSTTNTRCPINEKLGEFRGNVAHSVPNYGLRIFHGHSPRTFPCSGISYDADNGLADPYAANPLIQAYYEDFVGYKCGRNGVIAGNLGAVTLRNMKTVDNALVGLEIEKVVDVKDGIGRVEDSVIVGRSMSNDQGTGNPHGIVSPRTDKWTISNIRFHNYDWGTAAALGTCSHCYSEPATDSDGRTVKLDTLSFTNVDKRIRYQFPFKGILEDIDGSLTDSTPGCWCTSMWQHNAAQPECSTDMAMMDGLVCDDTVGIRRILMYSASPGSLNSRDLYILPYDDSVVGLMTPDQLTAYIADTANYSIVPWRAKKNPKNHWNVPFVTGKKYLVRWAFGLDFEKMTFEIISWLWEDDELVEFEMPHYDVREAVYVDTNLGERVENNTIAGKATTDLALGDNLIRNDTDTRKINLMFNGDNDDLNRLTLTGIRCMPENCAPEIPDDIPLDGRIRFWSKLSDWTDGRTQIPQAGEDVIIPSSWTMMYDVALGDEVKLNSLEVNGELIFDDRADRTLKAYNLWVRSGKLEIGTADKPFTNKAIIELQGDNTEEYFTFTQSIEAGNKNLVITGDANMYGLARDYRARLMKTSYRNNQDLIVPAGLDWVAGEMIVIAPTNMRTMDKDSCEIESYNNLTGNLRCKEPLMGFHFGAEDSTEDEYGVDMRAEIALLSRNIEITASQDDINSVLREPWGCRVLVSDFLESNAEMTIRKGQLNMDNVSLYRCSQKFTWKAGLKFENALLGTSSITNSSIHHGKGIGVMIEKSQSITFSDNIVTDFAEHGIWVLNSKNIEMDNNWLFHVIQEMDTRVKMQEYFGWKGGFTLSEGNSAMTITNNIVAGTWHHGFHFIPKRCDDSSPSVTFKDNIAHSISGYGAIAMNVVNSCTEVHDFTAYKVTEASIMLGGASKINRGRNLIAIDTRYSIGVVSGGGGDSEIIDSKVYGELQDNMDCPQGSPCDHCMDTRGLMLNSVQQGAHRDREDKWTMLPLFKESSAMTGESYYDNVELINFTTNEKTCGARQAAVMPFLQPDYTPFAEMKNIRFTNVAHEAVAFIQDPPQGWANEQDCVEFTCTGMYNIAIYFSQVKTGGDRTPFLPTEFTIVSDNKESTSVQVIPGCEKEAQWNAWLCSSRNIGVMLFDNLDADRMDRAVHPVFIQNESSGFNNRLNSFMDHCWDGFYTCQKRESRFPTVVFMEEDYNIEYTGTPPAEQEFRLFGRTAAPGFTVTIQYNAAGAYQIYDKNNQVVQPTLWDPVARTWAAVQGNYCGEFRYEGVLNRLQFYLANDDDCVVYVRPRDAVMLQIRMEFTLEEFFADGGVVSFTDRMAGVLGIHASDMLIVSVYEGSTIVHWQVLQRDENTTEPEDMLDLERVERAYRALIGREDTFMGSKILNAEVNGEALFSPFEKKRTQDPYFDGFTDRSEFLDDVIVEEKKTEETIDPASKNVDDMLVDESDYVTTKRIVIKREDSVLDNNKGYLIISAIIVMTLAAIMVILCVANRCGKKKVLTIAETVRQERKRNADFDSVAVAQYQPRINDNNLAVPGSARNGQVETESGGTHTARDLLSDKETAPVRMDDDTASPASH